jgi:hypothetical protein
VRVQSSVHTPKSNWYHNTAHYMSQYRNLIALSTTYDQESSALS